MLEIIKNKISNYTNTNVNSFDAMIKTITDYYQIFNKKLEDYLTNGDIKAFVNLLKYEIKQNKEINSNFAEIVLSKIRTKSKFQNQSESFSLGDSSIKNILTSGIDSYKIDNLIASSSILTDGLINGISPKTIYSLTPALNIISHDLNNITISTVSNVIIFQSKDNKIIINKTHEELVNIGVISMRDAMELKRLDTSNYEHNLKEVYKDSKEDYRDVEDIELDKEESFENYTNIINNLKKIRNEDDYEETYDDEYEDYFDENKEDDTN